MKHTAITKRSIFTVAALGLGFALLADCKRDGAREQARVEAERIEAHGEQQADRLRERADQIREEARRQANAIENRAESTPTDRSGVVAPAQGGGPVVAAHITLARETYAAARCDREVRCSHVGAGRRYASREACLQTARADRNDSWDAADCQANGIDQAELDQCLAAVRTEDCGSPFDSVQRLTACRAGEVCRH